MRIICYWYLLKKHWQDTSIYDIYQTYKKQTFRVDKFFKNLQGQNTVQYRYILFHVNEYLDWCRPWKFREKNPDPTVGRSALLRPLLAFTDLVEMIVWPTPWNESDVFCWRLHDGIPSPRVGSAFHDFNTNHVKYSLLHCRYTRKILRLQ